MLNKKVIVTGFLSVLMAVTVFAESMYTVKSVTGKVQYESAPGAWKNIEKGMELPPTTNINTGLNSKLILLSGDKTITIKPMQKGTIEKLSNVTNVGNTKITKGASVNKSDNSKDEIGSKKGVATASSRASEAKEDIDWDE